MCSSKLWEALQRELMNHSKLPRMTRTPLGFCPKNIQKSKIAKICWFCGHKLCHFLSQLKGTFCRTPPVSSAAIISNPVLPASSFSTISAPFLGGVRGGVARSTWSTKLSGLWVEPPNPRWSEPSLNLSNDGIWSTYLDWWWSQLSQYESHLGAIYSKTIILGSRTAI